jgi:hypothetical protein
MTNVAPNLLVLHVNTSLSPRRSRFLKLVQPVLLDSLEVAAGDNIALQIYFWAYVNGVLTNIVFATGSVVCIGGNVANGATPLFAITTSTTATDGQGNVYYTATLNLNTTPLVTLMTGQSQLTCFTDIQIEDAADTIRRTVADWVTVIFAAKYNSGANEFDPPPTLETLANEKWPVPFILPGDASLNYIFGYFKSPRNLSISEVQICANDVPTGAALILDLTVAGAAQGLTLTLAANASAQDNALGTPISVTACQIIKIKVTQIGSSTPGSNLLVNVICNPN